MDGDEAGGGEAANQRLVLYQLTTLLTNPSSPCHQGQHGVGESQVGDEHQGHSPSRTLKQ